MAKRAKNYIESKNEALSLAESIGTSQEEKTLAKKLQNNRLIHQIQERKEVRRGKGERRFSSNNNRLEKAKEAVRERTAQMKKRKAEMRKTSGKPQESSDGRIHKRKAVSFV